MSSSRAADLRWRAWLEEFRQSGLTHAEFCRRRGISLHTFRKRLYALKAVAPGIAQGASWIRAEATRFLPVDLRSIDPLASIPTQDSLAIVLGGGLSNMDHLYPELRRRLPVHAFSDTIATPVLKNKHGDSSGVRGAAWLWPAA